LYYTCAASNEGKLFAFIKYHRFVVVVDVVVDDVVVAGGGGGN